MDYIVVHGPDPHSGTQHRSAPSTKDASEQINVHSEMMIHLNINVLNVQGPHSMTVYMHPLQS